MTEYDYSEEGYRRYMATQRRIAQWADDTANHASQYQSPFVPGSEARTVYVTSSHRPLLAKRHSSHSHSGAWSSRQPVPAPPPLMARRSQTYPILGQPSLYSSHYQSRGGMTAVPLASASQDTSVRSRQRTYHVTSPSRRSSGYSSSYRPHHHGHQGSSPTYVIQTPAPTKHHTNGYVIVPPGYGQVQVVYV